MMRLRLVLCEAEPSVTVGIGPMVRQSLTALVSGRAAKTDGK